MKRVLALVCTALALPAANAQVPPCPLGESITGTLTPSRLIVKVPLTVRTKLMLTAESLDFDIELRLVSKEADPTPLQDLKWAYSDARCGLEAGPGELSVEVFSRDGGSGGFRFSAKEGSTPKLPPDEWYAASIPRSEAVAERALELGQIDRSLRVLNDGFQFACLLRNLPAARRIAARHFAIANEKSTDRIEQLRARIYLGALDQWGGDAEHGRATLQAGRAELEELRKESKDPLERQKLASLACFLLDKFFDYERGEGHESAAMELCRQLLDAARLSANVALECTALSRLACLQLPTGDPRGARESAESAVALATKVPGKPQLLAEALAARAAVQLAGGDPKAACADAERALGLGPSHELQATILGRLAQAQIASGRCEGAWCTLELLDSLVPELHDDALPAQVLLLRARLCEVLGDLAGAARCLDQAGQGAEVALDRALLQLRGGDAALARATLRATLAGADGLRAPDLRARLLRTQAETEDELREFAAALESFAAAEATSKAAGDPLGELLARTGRAWILQRQDKLDEAHEILVQAEPLLEQAEVWSFAADAQDTLARIALRRGDARELERCLVAGERLLDKVVSPGLVRGARAGVRSRFTGFSDLCSEWAFLASARASEPAEQRRLVEQGWKRNSEWKGRILLEGLSARANAPGGERLPTLRSGEACIDYVGGIDTLYAYVATSERIQLVPLGERRAIEARATELVRVLADEGSRAKPAAFGALASRLYADLLAPVKAALGALPARLYLIPSPELSILPFDCLVDPACMQGAAPERFADLDCVIDRHEVVYCPSAAVLAHLQQHPPSARPSHLLVLADAVYNLESDPLIASRQGPDLKRLPHSRPEAESIASFVYKRDPRISAEAKSAYFSELADRRARLETPAIDMFLGSEARLERVRSPLSAYTHLHFAVHGSVDPLDPRRSGLVLSWEPQSGGLWPLEEILSQRLDAELVVLSACTTASGPVVRGEGVQSVANAFLEAGSRAVIATGWLVNDLQTSNLMQSVYRGMLEDGMGAGGALRAARLEFRGPVSRGPGKPVPDGPAEPDTAHPRMWGAWYFVGLGER